jgi:hypothetical protein
MQLSTRSKLHTEIEEFLYASIEGDDKEFVAQLLLRRAPWQDWALFYFVLFVQNCWLMQDRIGKAFKESVPQGPYRHA